MLKSLFYRIGSNEISVISDVNNVIESNDSRNVSWLHMQGDDQTNSNLLSENYSFNKLAIADSQRERHPPKFESFSDHIFIILRPIQVRSGLSCEFKQVAIFLGDNYLVTKTIEAVQTVEDVWERYEMKEFDVERSVRHIVYQIFRNVADDYLQVIYKIESRLEEIEDLIENDAKEIYLTELTKFNSSLRKIVRNLEYQDKVAQKLIQYYADSTTDQLQHEFKDVYEQIDRTLTLAKMYQGLCNDLINAHISITSHKVNQVVKILTVVTVLFLPLSFIVGLYGMNFEYIPELKFKYGYFFVIGFMVALEIFLILILRKLKWV